MPTNTTRATFAEKRGDAFLDALMKIQEAAYGSPDRTVSIGTIRKAIGEALEAVEQAAELLASPIVPGKWYREHTAQQLVDEHARRGIAVPADAGDDVDALADSLNADDARGAGAVG